MDIKQYSFEVIAKFIKKIEQDVEDLKIKLESETLAPKDFFDINYCLSEITKELDYLKRILEEKAKMAKSSKTADSRQLS